MATRVKTPKCVLAIGTDPELIERSKNLYSGEVLILQVKTCDAALRYLDRYKDADEVWVYFTALGDRTPQFFESSLKRRHPDVKVWFVATTFKQIMNTAPEINWWILEPKQGV
ncbi:hypothetical protein A3I99_02295 [Candidatus Kaiserbacteria bacterium RIFCSPLOWO2_02_FULL_45_11b]|uniref:Uncharacterized protein n=1 Tax=Candidatus Kaiserbacteria bacterium RIFCSPLOWO2_12_FULL_45_26 TaxID=1798525 RepID=A0A1F6FF51_9BACT|nr:MAG: hypothetical protein A2Z56_01905 [Candidatus Kaiserbacteria bacterium RIFCSPHIGHO2_12_45_16]OGG70221.1 MAG: hypothetical protein A2929_04040 [Candidatus Kaiserbacteria bacterium RIFCSPLOWO2_01_FULL_45_25]OGG81889.1 MAG: hypothetical protein A3I99_02295 [Candidatus Kaiserbacteria bacterium RIFCSPLOWO2_02_FULL_45_11b]OGG84483.1 MAG: hypothetical protein A3G90_00085 [Candidatus Kaiserbacteria bacterium RIFCSPLOWO2_12_FULL_45_26]